MEGPLELTTVMYKSINLKFDTDALAAAYVPSDYLTNSFGVGVQSNFLPLSATINQPAASAVGISANSFESLSDMDFDLSSWLSECKDLSSSINSPPAVPELDSAMWSSGVSAPVSANAVVAAAATVVSAGYDSFLKSEEIYDQGNDCTPPGHAGTSACLSKSSNPSSDCSTIDVVNAFVGTAHVPQHDRFLSETSDDSSGYDGGSGDCEQDDDCMMAGSTFGDIDLGQTMCDTPTQSGSKKPRKRKLACDLSPHELAKTREINRVAAQRHRMIAKQKKQERKDKFEAMGRRNEELRREMQGMSSELNTLKKLVLSMYGPSGARHTMLMSRAQLSPLPSLM